MPNRAVFFADLERGLLNTRPDRGLRKLAEETGGGYFELKSTDALGEPASWIVSA